MLTWPGGLSTLVARMRAAISAMALAAARHGRAHPRNARRPHRIASPMTAPPCGRAVCAMPLFVAQRLLPDIRAYGYDPAVHASPRAAWMVSNFVMDGYPLEAPGEPLSWDNVVYQGQGLGYVVSTHQLLRVARSPRSVFTATML